MNNFKGLLAIIICLSLLSGCSVNPQNTQIGANVSFAQTHLENVSNTFQDSVHASNRLGYHLLLSTQKDTNTLFSPVSLSIALAMAYNAASGETAENIAAIMGDTDPTRINAHYNALMTHLNRTNDEDKIQIGNSFWMSDTLVAKQPYVDILSKNFDAEIHSVDFGNQKTVALINAWIEAKTNGLLKDTLKEIDPLTLAYLMNTVYFKGKWVNAFEEASTASMPFYLENGSSHDVSMMMQTASFQYFANSDVQVAALPYKDQTRMVIYLPKNDLQSFMKNYDYDQIAALKSAEQMNRTRLTLSLPKFEYKVSNPLKKPLIEMGMIQPFDETNADFSNMVDIQNAKVFIGDIFQNARIINDEGGTEAAAVTVIEFTTTSMPLEEDPIEFNCNAPFLYIIEDITTGAALFMGTYLGM